ncbi:restriction modification system DNA specificity subunit [Mycolicibacter terrae]|nr:restriction modification system DNA specificity subunit [Mycolicibacter terrae]
MRNYLRAANVGWNGLLLDDVKRMNFTDAEMAVFRLELGDLLLNEASGSPLEVGKPALWQGEIEDCAYQNTLLRVRPGPEIDPRYLLHFFRYEAATGAFARGSRGVGIHHLGRAALSEWSVPLCCLDEQRRIAAILDQADALRASQRQVLAEFERLAEAIFTDLFGDPVGGGSSLLGDIADIQIGPFGSLLHREDYVESGVPLVNPMHIVGGVIRADPAFSVTPDKAGSLSDYRLHAGDVIMGRRGEMGRCAVVAPEHEGYLCGTGSLILRPRPDRSVGGYLHAALSHPRVKAMLKRVALGSTLPNLNATIVKSLPVSAPSLAEQRHFVAISSRIAAVRGDQSSALYALDALFGSLQSRAFRGEL